LAHQDDLQQKLRMGIDAARRGDKTAAQLLLRQVVAADPQNELAWMWLASAVESLDERRACLEHALRINPNNTRAREALRRLQPSGTAAPAREATPRPRARPQPTADRPAGRSSNLPIFIGVIIGLAVLTALIFGLVSSQQPRILSPDELAAALTPTATRTIDPDTFTATPSPYMRIVTADVNLPPTFTPTFTPSPSEPPPPSATPIPLSAFTLIYTSLEPGQAVPALYQAAGDGSSERQLGEDVRDVAFDPTGQRIAFVRDVTITSGEGEAAEERIVTELFIAPVNDLGAAQQITEFGSTISHPTWAPDGIQLAIVSDYDGDEDIWTLTDDGQNVRKLTENIAVDRDPAWSPDGSRIVFVSDQASPGLTRLFSMSPEGENITQLNSLGGNTYQPHWSQDGSHLVFVNDGSGDGDIYIADAQGQSSLLVTADDGGAEDRSPAFTPDGNWVSFISNREGEAFQLFITDLRGDVLTRLTNNGRDDQTMDFRPELLLRLRTN
jgi:Tol biopolymer transport system component